MASCDGSYSLSSALYPSKMLNLLWLYESDCLLQYDPASIQVNDQHEKKR